MFMTPIKTGENNILRRRRYAGILKFGNFINHEIQSGVCIELGFEVYITDVKVICLLDFQSFGVIYMNLCTIVDSTLLSIL